MEKKHLASAWVVSALLLQSCLQHHPSSEVGASVQKVSQPLVQASTWIETVGDIPVPNGCTHLNSAFYSRYSSKIKVLPKGSPVLLYNGQEKGNQTAQYAVLDIDVGSKDLQQCADATMRMRSEFLFADDRSEEIQFDFTNGDTIPFARWMQGFKPQVRGNSVSWAACSDCDASYISLKKYLELIYTYAGTASLDRQLENRKIDEVQAGDVLIQGGYPGHAVMVMAVAQDSLGQRYVLLAQSYMPAQQIHILINPNDAALSPWYALKEGKINTPEWSFEASDLHQWPD